MMKRISIAKNQVVISSAFVIVCALFAPSAFATESREVDLGETDVNGSIRSPQIQFVDSQRSVRDEYGKLLKKEYLRFETSLLKPPLQKKDLNPSSSSESTSSSQESVPALPHGKNQK